MRPYLVSRPPCCRPLGVANCFRSCAMVRNRAGPAPGGAPCALRFPMVGRDCVETSPCASSACALPLPTCAVRGPPLRVSRSRSRPSAHWKQPSRLRYFPRRCRRCGCGGTEDEIGRGAPPSPVESEAVALAFGDCLYVRLWFTGSATSVTWWFLGNEPMLAAWPEDVDAEGAVDAQCGEGVVRLGPVGEVDVQSGVRCGVHPEVPGGRGGARSGGAWSETRSFVVSTAASDRHRQNTSKASPIAHAAYLPPPAASPACRA